MPTQSGLRAVARSSCPGIRTVWTRSSHAVTACSSRGGVPGVLTKDGRTGFECALIRAALGQGKPILGSCNGMQLLGQILGATFMESIAAELPEALDHCRLPVPSITTHAVTLTPGSRLRSMAGTKETSVNSLHCQAIAGTGAFAVPARAPDGVVEAIEAVGQSFAVGVQWHPEYRLTALDDAIMAAFVTASRPA